MKTNISARSQRLEQRRLKAAVLFRRGTTQAEVARRFTVSPEAARQWHNAWKRGGKAALTSQGNPGAKPRLTEADKRNVERVLLKGPTASGFGTPVWTLARMQQVIRRETGVRYHPAHVWKILTNMGWTRQKPEQRARERNEAAIRKWVEETWPGIKKRDVVIM
jgi:transposase